VVIPLVDFAFYHCMIGPAHESAKRLRANWIGLLTAALELPTEQYLQRYLQRTGRE
jgi:hypothetical protein